MDAIQLIVFFLATWRTTVMFIQDDGPFGFLEKTREIVGANKEYNEAGEIGRLLSCPYCTSVWVGLLLFALVALYPEIFWGVCYILAASGVASLIEERR